ncbi:MAG: hypothetical protein HY235_10705 [Acidobacteria bacterium]|nr:hypothetical protein [Acidobacteriota bacterium]
MIPQEAIEGTKLTNFRSFVWHGRRWRMIWSTLHHRDTRETFQDFVIELLKDTLGRDWIAAQEKLPVEERHVVVRWLEHFNNLAQSPMRLAKGVYVLSGPMKAAELLAYDLYLLQLVNKLPDSLVERLRDRVAFQGARYEVAIASIFARADFEIELLDEKVKKTKHCEFVAKHKRSGIEVFVEAKSRRRRGVLNEKGTQNAPRIHAQHGAHG